MGSFVKMGTCQMVKCISIRFPYTGRYTRMRTGFIEYWKRAVHLSSWWAIFLGVILQSAALYSASPVAVYLSWVDDPSTTMVVQWIESKEIVKSVLRVSKEDGEEWKNYSPLILAIEDTEVNLKRVFLEHLEPESVYVFEIRTGTGSSKSYRFKTMPKQIDAPVGFVVGGDLYYHYDLFRKMNAVVASLSPDFVVLGGDIAYAYCHEPLWLKQKDWQWRRWRTFLQCWTEQMVDGAGRLIPLLAVVGNHDVRGSYNKLMSGELTPSLFYTLFPFKQELIPYREIVFGDYLALFLLDSGHTHPVDKAQAVWLKTALQESHNIPYKLAVYHIPAYPSHSKFTNRTSTNIRNAWSPLFDMYGVQAVFEHHNHTYKRTKPIRGGKVDETGVIYFGDGSWGVPLRYPRTPAQEWYLEKSARIHAVYYVKLDKETCQVFAVDNTGKVFDKASIMPQHSEALTDAKGSSSEEGACLEIPSPN